MAKKTKKAPQTPRTPQEPNPYGERLARQVTQEFSSSRQVSTAQEESA